MTRHGARGAAALGVDPRPSLVIMCAWCRDIRDDRGLWRAPPIRELHHGNVSHGICPRCFRREAWDLGIVD